MVVEAQEAVERALELRESREVATTELDAPVLVEDRALQTLDEAVGPGVLEVELAADDLLRAPRWRPLRVAGAGGVCLSGFWCRRGASLLTLVAEPVLAPPQWIAP